MTTRDNHSRLLLPVLFIGAFMYILDVFIVYVAAPSLHTELGASESQVQWVVGGYVLTFAVALIPAAGWGTSSGGGGCSGRGSSGSRSPPRCAPRRRARTR